MNESKCSERSVIANKSLVLHEAIWKSIIRRSEKVFLKNDQLPLEVENHYMNYLYEGSRTMANKLKSGAAKSQMKKEKEEHEKIGCLKFNEFIERFKESDKQSFDSMKTARVGNATEACKNNLSRRKQDEYKRELRQFIENKRQIQIVLKEAKCERQRLERLKINSDLNELLKKEQMMLAKQKAAKRIIELESVQISERKRQRMFTFT